MSETKKVRRTPEQLIAEANAKAAQLQAKAAAAIAKAEAEAKDRAAKLEAANAKKIEALLEKRLALSVKAGELVGKIDEVNTELTKLGHVVTNLEEDSVDNTTEEA